jgi:TRAP-type C4-dicarboxylate transport system permease small subunit
LIPTWAVALDGLCDRVNRLTEIVIGLLIGATVAVTFLQVVCRYGLDSSLSWSEEFSRYAFIWAIFLGSGAAARRGQHMAVDLVPNALAGPARRLLELFIALVGVVFFAVFGYAAYLLTDNAVGQISTALQVPIALIDVSAPIGAALVILHLVNGVIQARFRPAARPAETDAAGL